MLSELRVGPITGSDGAVNPQRADKTGATVCTDAHGRYTEAALRGNLYFASNSIGVATTAGRSATAAGLIVYNPTGSGVNAALIDVTVQSTVDPAADAAVWLVATQALNQAAPTSVTALEVRNAMLGGSCGRVVAYSAATLAAIPNIIKPLQGVTFGTAVGITQVYVKDELAGSLVLPPSMAVAIEASSAITVVASMLWEEIPLSQS